MTPKDRESRLRYDHSIVSQLHGDLVRIAAYRSAEDLARNQRAIVGGTDAGKATNYLVEYRVPTLMGPGRIQPVTKIHFDLLAGGNYPYTEPRSTILGPVPWSPHFRAGSLVCTGGIWQEKKGCVLFAHLVLHVARLLNFDEPRHPVGYNGWNGDAIRHWNEVMRKQPVTPGLRYPRLPEEIHGLASSPPQPAFEIRRAVGPEVPRFAPRTGGR